MKTHICYVLSSTLLFLTLTACGGGGGDTSPSNYAPTASSVYVTDDNGGDAVVGDNLTGSYTYADAEGDAENVSTFRWLRDGVAISGATSSTYTLVVADSDTSITFEVTPLAAAGTANGNVVTSSGITVTNSAPTASGISIADDNGGNAVVNDSLTASYTYNDINGDIEGTSTFRWLRDNVAISGATSLTYTLVAADSGTDITFEVTPVGATGTTTGNAVTSIGLTVINSAPTASGVSITDSNGGNAMIGDILTGSYTYNDVDGDPIGGAIFRWLRNGVPINNATTSVYTLTSADAGQPIAFEVTPAATSGVVLGNASISSAIVSNNSAPVASSVSITDNNGGNTVVGDSLTGNYIYSDVDGDTEGTSTFRWLRNGSAISGATNTTYTLVAADSGTSITFEVTPVATMGTETGSTAISSGITVINTAPTTSSVSIVDDNGGNAMVGDNLTGTYTYNDVDGDAEGASTFRWLRNGTAISGETTSSYTLVSADLGQPIRFEVTPMAAFGVSIGNTSVSSAIVIDNSVPSVSGVSITDDNGGDVVVGDSLTGNYIYADVDGDLEGASTFRWFRDGTVISDATNATYTLVLADSETSITFEVTPVAATGTATGTAVASSGITVINRAPTASALFISDDNGGSAVVGDSLTGNYTYNDADGDVEGTSTFRWLRNGSTISGASDATYTLVTADSGTNIIFEVTPVADTGISTGSALSSGWITVTNSAPTASEVSITDDNGGYAVVGDSLTGNYTYADMDGDIEGTSTFRWLRDGVAISGATNTIYTLVAADSGTSIIFEVTPATTTGSTTSSAITSSALTIGAPPVVSGLARYLDINTNAVNDAGDQLIVPFDQAVGVNAADGGDFTLVSGGGGLGTGASISPGPATNEVTITLGTSPSFKTRQDFTGATTCGGGGAGIGFPSGIDVSCTMMPDAIESTSGIDAVASTAIDIIPAYVNSNQALGTDDSWSIALGDVDSDGDLDMVVGNYNTGTDRVYTNDGAGNFTDSGQSLDTNDSRSVALGDIDDDGDLDMVVAVGFQANRVYTNDGSGNFTDSGQSLGMNTSSRSVALGDIDDDGDLDMVVANGNGEGNRIYTNDGAGTFADSGQSLGSYNSSSVALGDLDGDGDLDMVVGNYNEANRVYTNDGTGTFSDSGQALGTYNSFSVALGDLDGDGDLDMVVANNANQENRVYTNDGTGTFTDANQSLGVNDSLSIALGDVDDDGDLDMVVANQARDNQVYTNDGAGIFADSGQSLGSVGVPGSISVSVALGDVDDDGDLDMVVANNLGPNRVYLNSLSGTWGSASLTDSNQSLGASGSNSVALGDINSDGDLDMVVATNNTGGNWVYTNDGAGTYADSGQSLGATSSNSIALGDIDDDGDLDMVVANNPNPNRIYTNDGAGIFADSGQSLGANNSTAVALGDIDGDGDLDMVVANYNQGNLVWTNDGGGIFADSGQSLGTNTSTSISLGDLDGDGDLDMVVANQGSNQVYTNDGAGIFADSGQSLGANNSTAVALGDIDGDGDLDMVVANYNQGNLVWTNDGTGTFSDSGQALGTNTSTSIALGDIDGDGDLDMVVANSSEESQVYTNDSVGVFTNSGQSFVATTTSSFVALDDVDGDGDLDMVVVRSNWGDRIFLNE